MPMKVAMQRPAVAVPGRGEESPGFYPESDGRPMAQNNYEHRTICHAAEALRDHFHERSDVHVRGDMFILYERGTRQSVVPDVMVVRGVEAVSMRSYKLWEVGKPPDFVLEIASPSTEDRDRKKKPGVYADLGVREFWRFDPTGGTFRPPLAGSQLRGERLGRGGYEALRPNGPDSIRSEVLGLDVRVVDGELRFWDPVKRRYLRTLREAQEEGRAAKRERDGERERRVAAERERDGERERRVRAEAEVAELRARLESLMAGRDSGED